ncbi:MAG: HAD family phosphatase [Ignavibacteriales bacterium]|nr:HAD family phosphatase [Ignavibacteriales bacterium]
MIKAVVFDLGNVLLPFDYTPFTQALDAVEPGLSKIFSENYQHNYTGLHRAFERGDMSDSQFLDEVTAILHHKVSREHFCKIFSEVFRVNEDVAALLPKLRQNYRVFLLSNTNNIHRQYGWNKYSFLQHFEKLFLSYEVNAVKPEKKIYETVSSYSGLLPEEHIFIDDVADYAQGARDAGWDAIQFTGYDNLVKELQLRDIKF